MGFALHAATPAAGAGIPPLRGKARAFTLQSPRRLFSSSGGWAGYRGSGVRTRRTGCRPLACNHRLRWRPWPLTRWCRPIAAVMTRMPSYAWSKSMGAIWGLSRFAPGWPGGIPNTQPIRVRRKEKTIGRQNSWRKSIVMACGTVPTRCLPVIGVV